MYLARDSMRTATLARLSKYSVLVREPERASTVDGVDPPPSRDEDIGYETRKLWLASLLARPSEWRSRAATLAGLLSAAAAASIAGVLFGPTGPETPYGRALIVLAAAAYVLAVIAFMGVTVFPNPDLGPPVHRHDAGSNVNQADRVDHSFTARRWWYLKKVEHPRESITHISLWTDWAESYAIAAAAPLRDLTLRGSLMGALAVLCTFLAALSTLLAPPAQSENFEVTLLRSTLLPAVVQSCPDITPVFLAEVLIEGSTVAASVTSSQCGGRSSTFYFERGDVLLVRYGQ